MLGHHGNPEHGATCRHELRGFSGASAVRFRLHWCAAGSCRRGLSSAQPTPARRRCVAKGRGPHEHQSKDELTKHAASPLALNLPALPLRPLYSTQRVCPRVCRARDLYGGFWGPPNFQKKFIVQSQPPKLGDQQGQIGQKRGHSKNQKSHAQKSVRKNPRIYKYLAALMQ